MKSVLKNNSFVLLLLLSLISCKDKNLVSSILPSEPIVRLLSPQNNQVISDSVTIQIETYDDKGIRHLSVYIDDIYQFSDNKNDTIHCFFWNTSYLSEGSHHKIKALGDDGEGYVTASKEIDVVVYRFTPSNLTAHLLTDSTIELNWQDNSKYETGYEIEQAGEDSVFTKIASLDSNETNYIVKGNFSPEQKYQFRVRAFVNTNPSWYSNTASAELFLIAPTNLTVDFENDTTAILNWNDNSFFEDEFEIEMKGDNDMQQKVLSISKNTTKANVSIVFFQNHKYSFRIKAKSKNYFSGFSNEVSQYFQLPKPVSLNSTQLTQTSIKLAWDDNSSFEEGFLIQRGTSVHNYMEISRVAKNVTFFIDDSLDVHQKYYYKVFAYTKHNTSDYISCEIICSPAFYWGTTISIVPEYALMMSHDEQLLAVKYIDKRNELIDLFRNSALYHKINSNDPILKIASNIDFSWDGNFIAGLNNYKNIVLWHNYNNSIYMTIPTSSERGVLRFNPDQRTVALADSGRISFWNYLDGTFQKSIVNNNIPVVTNFAFSNSGKYFLIEGASGLSIWDVKSGEKLRELTESVGYKNASFSKNDNVIIANNQGAISVWNVQNGILLLHINNGQGTLQAEISYDNNYIYCVSENFLSCYLYSNGEIINRIYFTPMPTSIILTKDGKHVIGKFKDKIVSWYIVYKWI